MSFWENIKKTLSDAGKTVVRNTPAIIKEPISFVLEQLPKLAIPYREIVAEPISTALLGLSGEVPLQDAYKTAQKVSPGQALVAALGNIIPGQQDVDKINFTKKKEVDEFYNKGAAKFWSGFADFNLNIFLDPLVRVGLGASKLRTTTLNRPIKNGKDLDRYVNEVDRAVREESSPLKPQIDFIMSDEVTSATDIMTSGLFSHSTKLSDLSQALIDAKSVGREAVGDILKIGAGDVKTADKYKDTFESVRKAFLEQEQISDWVRADLTKPIIGGEFHIPSAVEGQRLLRQAQQQLDELGKVDDDLLRILQGPYEVGTQYDGLFGTIRSSTSAKYEFLERAKVKRAAKATENYWSTNIIKSNGKRVRVLSWLDRGNLQKETPAGMVITNERGTQSAVREVAANIKLIQKKTNQPVGWAKSKLDEFIAIASAPKKTKNDWLENFEDEATFLIIKSKIPAAADFDDVQMEHLRILAKEISKGYRTKKVQELYNMIDNKYHVLDDNGNPVYVESMKKLIDTIGENSDIVKSQLRKKLEGTPLLESDISTIIHLMDFDALEKVITDSSSRFNNLAYQIKNSGLDEKGLRELTKQIASGKVTISERNLKSNVEVMRDAITGIADTYNSVWKPITLMRLGYAQRNVGEGGLRIPVAFQALTQELGYTWGGLAKEILPGKETVSNAINNIYQLKKVRKGQKQLSRQKNELEVEIVKDENLIRQSTESLNELMGEHRALKKQLGTIASTRVKDVKELLKLSVLKFPEAKQKELNKIINDFMDETVDDSTINIEKTINLLVEKLQNKEDLEDFAKVFTFFNKALNDSLNDIDNMMMTRGKRTEGTRRATKIAKYPITAVELDVLQKLRLIQIEMATEIETIASISLTRAATLDRLQFLVTGATPEFKRIGEGTFEAFKGVYVTDAYAGVLGAMAKDLASAAGTVRTVVGGNNKNSLISSSQRRSSSIEIEPTNPEWANSFTHYFNTKLHNDAIAVKVAEGKSDVEIHAWLISPEAKKYRKNAETGIKEWGRGNLRTFIQSVRLITERALVESDNIGIDLRQALVKGNLTEEQALRIPRESRITVQGSELYPLKDTTISGRWNRATELFFKYLGSLPEDVFLRHPLYRSIYRNEVRSLGNLLKSQGVELTDDVLESLGRQAHSRANKVLIETLYTVERTSSPAEFFRFASPFYMAQQNSAKFWIGESIKNPAIPLIGIMAWNSVNESMNVRDVDEFNKRAGEYTVPFNSGEQIWITLPKFVAKALGTPDLEIRKISKDSMNLILQGAFPFLPGLGAPVQAPAQFIAKKLAGGKFDPDKELNKFGFLGDTVRELVFGPRITSGIEGIVPSNAWLRNARDYFFYEQSDTYWQRTNLILEKKMLALNESGEKVTADKVAKAFKDASRQARNSFLNGILFGAGSPVSVQVGTEYELLKSEYKIYLQNDPVNGSIKFEEDYGSLISTYAKSSLSSNPAGIFSNNKTIKNIQDYKGLFEKVFLTDEAVAGALVNTGTIDDFSPVAYNALFNIKVAGQPLRSKKQNVGEVEKNRQINAGWSAYIPVTEYYDSIMESKGIKPGTKAAEPYDDAKRRAAEKIAEDFPLWGENKSQEINLSKVPTVKAVFTVLNDDKFSEGAQAKTPLWEGLRAWAEVREYFADMVEAEGKQQAGTAIKSAYLASVEKIKIDYPEFGVFFERNLASDKLDKVKIRLNQ